MTEGRAVSADVARGACGAQGGLAAEYARLRRCPNVRNARFVRDGAVPGAYLDRENMVISRALLSLPGPLLLADRAEVIALALHLLGRSPSRSRPRSRRRCGSARARARRSVTPRARTRPARPRTRHALDEVRVVHVDLLGRPRRGEPIGSVPERLLGEHDPSGELLAGLAARVLEHNVPLRRGWGRRAARASPRASSSATRGPGRCACVPAQL
jgi:hypothetical protein